MAKKYKEQWQIASFTEPDKWYTVSEEMDGSGACSCPAWIFSKRRDSSGHRPPCKHIDLVFGNRSQFVALTSSASVAAKMKSVRQVGTHVEMDIEGGWTIRQARTLGTEDVRIERPTARKGREL